MESQSSPSSSLSILTDALGENEGICERNQMETRLPRNDTIESDIIGNNESEATVPSSLSRTRSSSCTDISSRFQQGHRRRRREHSNQGQHLETQLRQDLQRQQRLTGEEAELDLVQPATNTTMSQKSLFVLRPVHRYVDLVCISLSVLAYLLETTMNAALAIFGIGVGVGLVLGDSFRATLPLLPSVQASRQQQQQTQQSSALPNNAMEGAASHGLIAQRSVPNTLPAQ